MAKPVAKTPLQGAQIKSLESVGIKGLKTLEDAKATVIKKLEKHDLDASVIEDEELEILIDMLTEFESGEEEEELDELVEELDEEEFEEEEELEDDEDLEEEEEEEEIVAPVKKAGSVAKPNIPINKAKPNIVAKTTQAVAKVVSKGSDDKFDGRENKKHLDLLKPFKAYFPESEGFQFDILKQGFTVRMVTGNTKQTIFNFDGLRIVDGGLLGALYCNRFKNVEELIEVIPEDYHDHEIGMFRGESHPCIRKVSTEDVVRILEETSFIELSMKKAGTIDKRMVDNRAKLENSLTAKPKTVVATPAAKTAAAPLKKVVAPTVVAKKVVIVKKK